MVDEFQDTNFAQYAIVRKLAAVNENICVVGDDAQSIYAFRGANIQNILNFEKDYPDLKVFKLEQNYRSTQTIVHAANSVIVHNKAQLKKNVWTQNDEGEKIRLIRALSDNEEGMMVAQTIYEAKLNKAYQNQDFAILYRTNAQSRSMEEGLRKLNIPYRIYGGLSFYKRKEIKDVLAYVRLAINHNDEEALKRVINYPTRGIGKTSMDKLLILADSLDKSMWEVMAELDQYPGQITGAAKQAMSDFVVMIKAFAILIKEKDAFEALSQIASGSGVMRDLFNDKTPEGVSRHENVQELLNGVQEFVDAINDSNEQNKDNEGFVALSNKLDVYMQDIALLTDADEKNEDTNKVSLMTIHAAKGLEFKEVFVVGLEENLFPSQLSVNSREDLEEERRLFYVAVTRAEHKLSLSYANTRYRWGNLISCEPSRFLTEIDSVHLEANIQRERASQMDSNWGKPWQGQGQMFSTSKHSTSAMPGKGNFKPMAKVSVQSAMAMDPGFVADDTSNLQVGMRVEHQRFGTGQVASVEGQGQDRKASIEFVKHGPKQLLLKFAKLRILQ